MIIAFSANAQFKLGVGGGLNIAKQTGDYTRNAKNLIGFNSGFILEIKLPTKIGLELDVLYSVKGSKFDYGADNRDVANETMITCQISRRIRRP